MGSKVLTIEFNNSVTISFYDDSTAKQPIREIKFVKKQPFTNSYIDNLKSHLNNWLSPLAIEPKLFMIHFEILYVGHDWMKVCVSNSTGKLMWLRIKPWFTVGNWDDFLTSRKWIKPIDEQCYPYFVEANLKSRTISSNKVGCMKILGADGDWLTIAYSPLMCEYASSFDHLAYLRWRDEQGHLLIRL